MNGLKRFLISENFGYVEKQNDLTQLMLQLVNISYSWAIIKFFFFEMRMILAKAVPRFITVYVKTDYCRYKMADHFGDSEIMAKILDAPSTIKAEEAMKEIKGFDEAKWNEVNLMC